MSHVGSEQWIRMAEIYWLQIQAKPSNTKLDILQLNNPAPIRGNTTSLEPDILQLNNPDQGKHNFTSIVPSPLLSILLEVLTVSPKRQYRGIFRPTTPAHTGPDIIMLRYKGYVTKLLI